VYLGTKPLVSGYNLVSVTHETGALCNSTCNRCHIESADPMSKLKVIQHCCSNWTLTTYGCRENKLLLFQAIRESIEGRMSSPRIVHTKELVRPRHKPHIPCKYDINILYDKYVQRGEH